MKKTRKAFLLSAFVLPGLGQLTLKRYKTGIVLVLVVTISFFQLLAIAVHQANAIVDGLLSQGGTADIMTITDAAQRAADNSAYQMYVWLIIACWLLSLVDVWLAGRRGDAG